MSDAKKALKDALFTIAATGRISVADVPAYKKIKKLTKRERREFFQDLEEQGTLEFSDDERFIAGLIAAKL